MEARNFDSYEKYWEKEEFEDLVARGLLGMYEKKFKKHKHAIKHTRFTEEMLDRVRNLGCYFAANDRVLYLDLKDNGTANEVQNMDIINEGRPDFAISTWIPNSLDQNDKNSMRYNCYLEHNYMERIFSLPKPLKCTHDGRKYRLITMWINNNGFVEAHCHYVVIDSLGNIYPTYWIRDDYDPISQRCKTEIVTGKTCQSDEESKRAEDISTVTAHVVIQSWQDRRFLWNVAANEGFAKATFTVYPEQIKSLFYAREMPMTETGRKRPILHWVAAHQRRIKSGIDVDIEKHLRGINEFVYQGTKFNITRPIKIQKELRR